MAARIPILMQYNGKWSEHNKYEDFQVDGILIPLGCSYDSLLDIINKQLNGTTENSILDIKYVIGDGYPPLRIKDDMTLIFYLELKIKEPCFKSYLLCITKMEKCETEKSSKTSSSELGMIEVEPKTTSLLLNQDIPLVDLDETIINMMDYLSLVSKQTVDNLNNKSNEVEQDEEELVTNPSTGSSISSFNAGVSTSALTNQSLCFNPYSAASTQAASAGTAFGSSASAPPFGLTANATFSSGSSLFNSSTSTDKLFCSGATFGLTSSTYETNSVSSTTSSTSGVFDSGFQTPKSSIFGSAAFSSASSITWFPFGASSASNAAASNTYMGFGLPNLAAPQNQYPFQASGSLEFNAGGSFLLGTGGDHNSNRMFGRVSSKRRKR